MADAQPHPASLDAKSLLTSCEIRFTRRSGPGGQNRNKVETAVILRHEPTGLTAEASEQRTQGGNRLEALRRLRLVLARHVRRPIDETPSALWRGRLQSGRITVNPQHDDFPALLAETLDALAAAGQDPRIAAERLGCSPTQLVKLVKDDPPAFTAFNALRRDLGLPALR